MQVRRPALLTVRVPMPAKTTFEQRMTMLEHLQSRVSTLPTIAEVDERLNKVVVAPMLSAIVSTTTDANRAMPEAS